MPTEGNEGANPEAGEQDGENPNDATKKNENEESPSKQIDQKS